MGFECGSEFEIRRKIRITRDEMYSNYSCSRSRKKNENKSSEAIFNVAGKTIAVL